MSILASLPQSPVTNSGNDKALAISLIVIFVAFVVASLALARRDARTHTDDTTEEYDG